jgi:anti-sigma B factor antagonist
MQSQPFELRINKGADSILIVLSGELDLGSAPQLEEAFEFAQRNEVRHVTVDLRDLTFLDSTGVRVFLEADLATRNGRAGISFIAGPRKVMQVLEITAVGDRLTWVHGEAQGGPQVSTADRDSQAAG